MATADIFVLLNNAQFQRSSWHCRNRIALEGEATFLTVPVQRSGLSTTLEEVLIDYSRNWCKSHEGKIRQAYARTLGGPLVIEALISSWHARPERLIDLNLNILKALAEILCIKTPWVKASSLGVVGKRSERLLEICTKLGAKHYLSPLGAEQYLEEDGFAKQSRISLHLQHFEPLPYAQFRATNFLPYMSVIDVIANMGADAAAEYVRQPAFDHFVKQALCQ